MTVAELLARVSSKELTRWMIFSQLEPFGSEAYFLGHAVTASTFANANRKKGRKPFKLKDFMPTFGRKKEQSVKDMIGMAAHITQAMGGKDLRE
jgi:hypothetical protein